MLQDITATETQTGKKQKAMGSRVQISAPILQAICGLVSSGEASVLGGLMWLDDCQPN